MADAPAPDAPASGTLFVVSTPIGNLGDITRRAAVVLGAADAVAAEDTRRTRALLSHLGIGHKPLLTLNAHSSENAVEVVARRVLAGESVALVTDAGTPAVSDPGRSLVALARERGAPVVVVPGPSAVTAAVALSGLVEGPFAFIGFWPRQASIRREAIDRIGKSREPIIFFESPQRLAHTLEELAERLPDRAAFIGRELTKLHEEGLQGRLADLAAHDPDWRGEIVVVIAANPAEAEPAAERREFVLASLRAALEAGATPSRIARALADISGLPRRELYERALEIKGELGPSSDDGGDRGEGP